jgi:hypothetical protein
MPVAVSAKWAMGAAAAAFGVGLNATYTKPETLLASPILTLIGSSIVHSGPLI